MKNSANFISGKPEENVKKYVISKKCVVTTHNDMKKDLLKKVKKKG